MNIFGGSTGWHRYYLFDCFIRNADDWFWLGTKDTESWGRGLWDVTNQYVLEAVRGGIWTLLVFLTIVFLAVYIPGRFTIKIKKGVVHWLCWGVCVSMLSHCVSFMGVSYFGQIMILLYFTFAVVAFVLEQEKHSAMMVRRRVVRVKKRVPVEALE